MNGIKSIYDAWKLTMEGVTSPTDCFTRLQPCKHCHASPTIVRGRNTGLWMALHKTSCPLPTATGEDALEVQDFWKSQQEEK